MDSITSICSAIKKTHSLNTEVIEQAFKTFAQIHPGLAARVIAVFGEKAAANWMASPNRSLMGLTPYDALDQGKDDGLLTLLKRIENSVIS